MTRNGIQRYDVGGCDSSADESPDGDWVKYDDANAKINQLRLALGTIASMPKPGECAPYLVAHLLDKAIALAEEAFGKERE